MNNHQSILSMKNLQRWRNSRVPVAPYFELTPRCTLDCKMCYVHLTHEQMGSRRELTAAEWIKISDEAVKAGMLFVILTGGECMLHPGFWEIFYHLRDLGVAVTVNTNAFTLTDDDILRFQANPPAAFRISLYGASEEGYERCTGYRAFAKVSENIQKLKSVGCAMGLALTLSRYNVEEFLELSRCAKSFHIPVRYVVELDEPYEETGRHLADFMLSNAEMHRINREIRLDEGLPIYENPPVSELPMRLPDDPGYCGMRCGAGKTTYVVHWDGRMSSCFMLGAEKSLNILEVGFQTAWEAVKQYCDSVPQPVECRTCRFRPICRACVLFRSDPKDPGHCDLNRCRYTIECYNLGLATLKNNSGVDIADCEDES